METPLYRCITWVPRRDHHQSLTTYHRLLLRVSGYRRKRGTYRPRLYAKSSKKTGGQRVEATIRWLLFAGALARQHGGRLTQRLMFSKLVGGTGRGHPLHHWQESLKDNFKAFGATDGSTDNAPLTFGIGSAPRTTATKKGGGGGASWYTVVARGAERFKTFWHKYEEEADRLRANK